MYILIYKKPFYLILLHELSLYQTKLFRIKGKIGLKFVRFFLI